MKHLSRRASPRCGLGIVHVALVLATVATSAHAQTPLAIFADPPTNPIVTSDPTPSFFFQTFDAVATFCNVDGDAFVACTSPFTTPALGDGSHVVSVYATDGVDPGPTDTFAFTIDTVVPAVSILVPPSPTDTNVGTPTFTFSVDPGGTAVATTCRVYAQFTMPPAAVPCANPFTVPTPLPNGAYVFEVIAQDAAGNVGNASLLFDVDTQPPAVFITGVPPIPTSNQTPQFTFSAIDTSTTTAVCRVDAGTFAPCASPFTVAQGVVDGAHTFAVQATDLAGNVGQAFTLFLVDTTPPAVQIAPGAPTVTSSNQPSFPFATTDANPGHSDCLVTGPQPATLPNCTSPFVPTLGLEGDYTLEVVSTDAAGNVGHAVHDFTIDTTPPTVTITTAPPDPTNDTAPTFGFVTGGSPVSTRCRIDGTPANDFDCAGAFTSPVPLVEGQHTFFVTAADAAGNPAGASRGFTIDTIPPDTVILSGEPPRTNHTTGTFAFSSEADATFQCRLDQGAFGPCTGAAQLVGMEEIGSHTTGTLLEGFHTFEVRAVDTAANPDPTPASQTWFVDLTAPVAIIASAPPNPSNDANPQFGFGSETGATFECHVDAATFVPCPALFAAGPLASGTHTMYVRAIDAVGNVGDVPTTYGWTVDLDAPDTVVTRLGPTPSAAIVSFVLTSNEPATFECDLDGTGFAQCSASVTTPPLANGTHTLVARAIDAAGNSDPSPAIHAWLVQAPNPPTTTDGAALCNGGPYTCKAPGVTTVAIRNEPDPNSTLDRFDFTWQRGDATTTAELGDPTVDTPYAVCVWDTVGGTPALVMAMQAPAAGNCAGRPCWQSTRSGAGVHYRDNGLLPDGIKELRVLSGPLGGPRVKVKARGIDLPDPPMPFAQEPAITVQVVNGAGACWGADYVVAPRTNTGTRLVVKEKP